MKKCLCISALLALCTQLLWAQEFAYVTDSLQLRVYSKPSAESELLQTIASGDSVEVFSTQDGFSRVSIYDGTEGWVKSAFLVEEPPDKLLYYSVSEKNKELEAEIEVLKNSGQNQVAVIDNEAETNKIYELQSALDKEQEINQRLQEQIADAGNAQTIEASINPSHTQNRESKLGLDYENKKWTLIGLPLALIIVGLLLGVKISSWRMKKRLHGFRFS
ncbi:MAG: TIGR04211 family SH3 domain-containing protein [Gammaproteobacteria bacterium]|nr:MAG: TIGR04211 family SH3 domain-containing protein [Gammaproteobacteria bacterium]